MFTSQIKRLIYMFIDIDTIYNDTLVKHFKRNTIYIDNDVLFYNLFRVVYYAGIIAFTIMTFICIVAPFLHIFGFPIPYIIGNAYINILSELVVLFASFFISILIIVIYNKRKIATSILDKNGHISELCNFKDFVIMLYDKRVRFDFQPNEMFIMPHYIKNMLEVSFGNLPSYFRMSNSYAYSLPMFRLSNIAFEEDGGVVMQLGLTSFMDIWYYQYNNTPIIIPHRERELSDIEYSGQPLKYMLCPILQEFYEASFIGDTTSESDNFYVLDRIDGIFQGVPNALGITGVIEFSHGEDVYYIVQFRSSKNVNPNKLQWSYAGLISYILDRYIAQSKLASNYDSDSIQSYVTYEIVEEVLPTLIRIVATNNDSINTANKEILVSMFKSLIDSTSLIAMILNSHMLYQPELILHHKINLGIYDKAIADTIINSNLVLTEDILRYHPDKLSNGIYLINKNMLDILIDSNIPRRHLFIKIWRILNMLKLSS